MRTKTLLVLVATSAPLAIALASRHPGASDSIATFRGDLAHTGVYRTAGVQRFGGLQWRVQTGGMVESSPAVSGGVVYIGSGDGYLYALDALTGEERWRFGTGRAITSSPTLAGGLVYVGSRDGSLFAVDATSGRQRWRIATGPDAPLAWGFESGDIFTSSPVCAGGLVLFGSGDGHLYAVDAASGAARWRFATGGRVRSSPAVADGRVFVGSMDGSVYAVALRTGRPIWRFDTEGHTLESARFGFDRRTIQSSPAVVDGRVFVGARDGHLYALDAGTGRLLWKVDHKMSWVITSPAVAGGLVYAGSSDAKFVQAVDAATGRERWRFTSERPVWSSPAIAGSMLYVGDGSGTIYAVDRETGAEQWRYRTGRRILSSPVLADGRLFVGNADGGVYARRGTDTQLRRAVFWDSADVRGAWLSDHEQLRDYLADHGYQVLDAAALARFLGERVRDRAPSVVVFALDHLPATVAPTAADTVLFRRYLASGGKAVWLGVPPLVWSKDPKTGDADYTGIDRKAGARLLGVDFTRSNFDAYGNRVTRDGLRWGLSGWWESNWSVDPRGVTTVLALDDNGLAGAWVKSYGGPPGTGFVRIYGGGWNGGSPTPNYAGIQAVAEYFPTPGR